MPTKCMAQIPMPIANAPPDNQYRAAGRPLAARTRFAMPNAVYDARTATPRDTRTSEGLYVPTSILGSCPGRIPPPRRPQFTSIRSQQLQIPAGQSLLSTLGIHVLSFFTLGGGCGRATRATGEAGCRPVARRATGTAQQGPFGSNGARATLDARPGLRDGLYRKRAFRSSPIFTSRGHDAAQLRPACACPSAARSAPRHSDARPGACAMATTVNSARPHTGPRGAGFAGPRRRP